MAPKHEVGTSKESLLHLRWWYSFKPAKRMPLPSRSLAVFQSRELLHLTGIPAYSYLWKQSSGYTGWSITALLRSAIDSFSRIQARLKPTWLTQCDGKSGAVGCKPTAPAQMQIGWLQSLLLRLVVTYCRRGAMTTPPLTLPERPRQSNTPSACACAESAKIARHLKCLMKTEQISAPTTQVPQCSPHE